MSTSSRELETRRALNPLFNDNKLKLGLFGVNVSNGCAITTVEGRHEVSWPNSLAIARTADRHGYEAMVPVARWRGFGGESNFNGTNFETYTWAAGLGQATENICVLTTSHVPTIHPIVAAKQATTVDHITNGRFALNVVCGWFTPELEMFGVPQMEHDTRYDYAAEWIEIMKLLWSREDEFDYDGKFLRVSKGFAMPKPVQKPFPALMNAGGSGKGRHFAAKYCDMAFVVLSSHNLEDGRAQIDAYRRLAREEYGRELQIWGNCYVVHGDTQKEAEAELNHYVVDKGDEPAVDLLTQVMGLQSLALPPAVLGQFRFHFKAGWGGYPLVGTADHMVDQLGKLADIGFDGMLLSWVDYLAGLERWNREVMPRLEQAGLRRSPHRRQPTASLNANAQVGA
jgi:alkanesulfonate monooxygenase SsuD/methylene tetrahydromethanopterin reductase-like flavin-dependent oxidoreductase (luciferase family)